MSQYAELGLPLLHAGKVREIYQLPDPEQKRLLMVATDNISAYDYILESLIPDKGKILTQLSLWWFAQLDDLIPNHLITADLSELFDRAALVTDRAIVCEKLEMIPVECVARGYLTGSGWAEYQKSQTVCGIDLPSGLKNGSKLPEAIFTPAIKAELGEHDENVDFETISKLHGEQTSLELKNITLALYHRAEQIARERGIILADTKFEFGRRDNGTLVLADEVLTPDSSRFWDIDIWHPGGKLDSFDKQYVRDWLVNESGWDKNSANRPPVLPEYIIETTRKRYLEAYKRLTGEQFG